MLVFKVSNLRLGLWFLLAIDKHRKYQESPAVPMKWVDYYLSGFASNYTKQQVYLRSRACELGLQNVFELFK